MAAQIAAVHTDQTHHLLAHNQNQLPYYGSIRKGNDGILPHKTSLVFGIMGSEYES